MKKVTVYWTEFHNFSIEMEIPNNLSHEEELEYAIHADLFPIRTPMEPYEINIDWDGVEIEDKEEGKE